VRETEIPVEQHPPKGVLVSDHAGLVINKFSRQVPALKVEGKVLGQSSAIMRFIGKLTGLYPTDAVTAALVDSIMDQVFFLITLKPRVE